MGLFSDDILEESQIRNLNNILPQKFRKDSWKTNDFKGDNSIHNRIRGLIHSHISSYDRLKVNIDKLETSIQDLIISNIKIFNTELYEAETLGMVDIGVIEKFAASSTGDRIAVGMIGYALEQAMYLFIGEVPLLKVKRIRFKRE